MATLESKNGKLYIDGKEVLKGWESYSGWYWFATEKLEEDYNGKPLWFGYVQGLEEEWGNFSEAEINSLGMRAWPIKKIDLPSAGRRG